MVHILSKAMECAIASTLPPRAQLVNCPLTALYSVTVEGTRKFLQKFNDLFYFDF